MTDKIGCFGSVLYQDDSSKRCSTCPLLVECKTEVVANRKKLVEWREEIRSNPKAAKATKQAVGRAIRAEKATEVAAAVAITDADPVTAKLRANVAACKNKKAREHAEKWLNKGVDVHAYRRGVNGFEKCGNAFAVAAMKFLMERKSCTHMELIDHLMLTQGWKGGTANSHATITFEAFNALEVVYLTGGKAHLR